MGRKAAKVTSVTMLNSLILIGEELDRDRRSGIWHAVDLPETAWATCAGLAHRHGTKLGTGTLDSRHVAAALELGAKTFWTFDERQGRLATAEGLSVS